MADPKEWIDVANRTCTMPGCGLKHVARGLCSRHYNKSRYTEDQLHPKREVSCVVCGTHLMRRVDNARLGGHCCSVECRAVRQWGIGAGTGVSAYSWNQDAKKRARSFGCLVIEDVDRQAVLDRDGWACYLCGKDTSLTDDPFSPDSATVDHAVPLSKGGHHTMGNVRCACLACNSSKAAREGISPAA